jgi:acyl carrier protein
MLRFKIASLLGFGEGQLDARRSLVELGLDSLMAVELRNWIESQIKIALPISQLMRNASLGDLVETVCGIVADASATSRALAGQEPASESNATIDSAEAKDLLEALPQLPQEEVAVLLAQMLREQGSTTYDSS